jgi:hypothetical protein
MKLGDLLKQRTTAGERYRNATDELHDALIELAALDAVLANRGEHMRTFFDLPQNLGTLAHPVFAPANTIECWRDEIVARRNELLAHFKG